MRMHHLHKVKTILSNYSTQIEAKVEDMVQDKEEVVIMATKVKVSNNNNKMICRD